MLVANLLLLLGCELVDFLIFNKDAETRAEAVDLGQALLKGDYIHHVNADHEFKDGMLLDIHRLLEERRASSNICLCG